MAAAGSASPSSSRLMLGDDGGGGIGLEALLSGTVDIQAVMRSSGGEPSTGAGGAGSSPSPSSTSSPQARRATGKGESKPGLLGRLKSSKKSDKRAKELGQSIVAAFNSGLVFALHNTQEIYGI